MTTNELAQQEMEKYGNVLVATRLPCKPATIEEFKDPGRPKRRLPAPGHTYLYKAIAE